MADMTRWDSNDRTYVDPERSHKYIRTAQDHFNAAQESLDAIGNSDTEDQGLAYANQALAHLKSCELLLMWGNDIKPPQHDDWAKFNELELKRRGLK